jgi:16S rRNA (guanine527-N7)-methyltransferase
MFAERGDAVMIPEMADQQTASQTDREAFEGALMASAASLGLVAHAAQRETMWAHFQRVVEANRGFNLTRIISPADAAVKHYADSLSLLVVPGIDATRPLRVLDVGTGAGFPAVPLAIVCDAWRMTAIDGTGKKARFVADVIAGLGLANVQSRHARAADLARVGSDSFDLVLLRAVGRLADGLAEVRSLPRVGAEVVFFKTANISEEELADGLQAADMFGFEALPLADVILTSADGPLHRRFVRYQRLPSQERRRGGRKEK